MLVISGEKTMDKKKDRYLYGLDILRIISTIAVLIYHINPDKLPGGYLAVCVFLVLHGYLFVVSNGHKEKFSIIGHFLKRIIRLYLPLVIVTALTIYGLRYTPDVIWLNEKPETLSVLGIYNNWWQINAGQSYFARVTNSPFTHMWYISMLLQVELVLPFIFKIYHMIKKKANFWLIWTPFCLLTIISMAIMPYLMHLQMPEMRIYFGTDARVFSILMGMTLGILHDNDRRITLKVMQFKVTTEVLFLLETCVLIFMFMAIGQDSPLYRYGFILASLLTMLIISLCTNPGYDVFRTLRIPPIKWIASISYEVYLTHYPLMFLANALYDFTDQKIQLYYVGAVIAISTLLHFALSIKFRKDTKTIILDVVKFAVLIPFILVSVYGGQDIINAKDHTAEMQDLENQLAESAELQEQLQKEFMEKRQHEMDMMNDPSAMAEEMGVANLPVTGIGDSVMLGAVYNLYETFPNGDFDAEVSRSHWALYSIIKSRSADGTLGNPVVIGIGTNGVMGKSMLEEIIEMCGDRYIYWLTITNDWQFPNNDTIKSLGEEHDNVIIVDWESYSEGEDDWFYYDGIHLTPSGRQAYADYIMESISKDLIRRKMIEDKEKLVMGIGDGYMLTSVDYLRETLTDAYMIAEEDLDYTKVLAEIQTLKDSDSLPHKVFIAVGNDQTISKENLDSLLTALSDCKVILIKVPGLKGNDTNRNIDAVIGSHENVILYDLSDRYQTNPEEFTPDRIHFNDAGSRMFADYILQKLEELNN